MVTKWPRAPDITSQSAMCKWDPIVCLPGVAYQLSILVLGTTQVLSDYLPLPNSSKPQVITHQLTTT